MQANKTSLMSLYCLSSIFTSSPIISRVQVIMTHLTWQWFAFSTQQPWCFLFLRESSGAKLFLKSVEVKRISWFYRYKGSLLNHTRSWIDRSTRLTQSLVLTGDWEGFKLKSHKRVMRLSGWSLQASLSVTSDAAAGRIMRLCHT